MAMIKITNIFMVMIRITKKMLFEISTNSKFYINTIILIILDIYPLSSHMGYFCVL